MAISLWPTGVGLTSWLFGLEIILIFLSRCSHLAIALDLYALSADSLSVLLLSVLKGNGIASIVGISVLISFTFAGNATGLDTAILFSSMITNTLVLLLRSSRPYEICQSDFDQPRQCQLRFWSSLYQCTDFGKQSEIQRVFQSHNVASIFPKHAQGCHALPSAQNVCRWIGNEHQTHSLSGYSKRPLGSAQIMPTSRQFCYRFYVTVFWWRRHDSAMCLLQNYRWCQTFDCKIVHCHHVSCCSLLKNTNIFIWKHRSKSLPHDKARRKSVG